MDKITSKLTEKWLQHFWQDKTSVLISSAKLWEDGKLDLDVPIQKYVASFPEKTFRGIPVTLTTRHLLSHLGGIRDYKKHIKSSNEKSKTENQVYAICNIKWTFFILIG